MGTVWAAEVIPRGSWKGEVGSSTPAGKRRLARDGANLTLSAHLVRAVRSVISTSLCGSPFSMWGPVVRQLGGRERRSYFVFCVRPEQRRCQCFVEEVWNRRQELENLRKCDY
jgi:hypothetical protein